jgi:hypothetical protein
MDAFYIILAVCPILLLGTAAFLVMIVVGIRKGDRGHLAPTPRNHLDSISRRVTGVGVRNDDTDNEQEA